MASQIGTRLAFEKAKKGIEAAGFSLNRAVLSQSYLRSELALSTSKTTYQFPILINDSSQGTITNTSFLLNLQDCFYISALAVFVAAPSSSTDTTFQLVTYPNASIFTTSGAAAALYSLYNGNLQMTINNRQVVSGIDIYRFYNVPQMQTTANADYTTSAINYKDQQNGSDSGLYPIEPGIVLSGSKQNVIQINLPAALAAINTNSRVVLYMTGHLAQNVTSVR